MRFRSVIELLLALLPAFPLSAEPITLLMPATGSRCTNNSVVAASRGGCREISWWLDRYPRLCTDLGCAKSARQALAVYFTANLKRKTDPREGRLFIFSGRPGALSAREAAATEKRWLSIRNGGGRPEELLRWARQSWLSHQRETGLALLNRIPAGSLPEAEQEAVNKLRQLFLAGE